MTITIINPNSTSTMTDAMVRQAQDAAPHRHFIGWTSTKGPAAIQGPEDGDAATPPLLDLVKQASDAGSDGIVIGCFDDTGLQEAAKIATCPVIGIGQAAYTQAALLQWRFSVVTTLSVSVPVLERNISRLGISHHLARVRASDVPVLALEENPTAAVEQILSEVRQAVAEDAIQTIILGCAGMVHVTEAVRREVHVPVIDPVICAATCFDWLIPGAAAA
ncbi:MAG: aspartate/glutamate racemase family protein [Pseudomonadota bacterium]